MNNISLRIYDKLQEAEGETVLELEDDNGIGCGALLSL